MSELTNLRIMVVDDSRLARATVESLLRAGGFDNLVLVSSAQEALDTLSPEGGPAPKGDSQTDLILMDISMPGMDGIEACRFLKGQERLKDIPVIMVTARDDLESLGQAFKAGAMDYINKPLVEVELMARINSALTLKAETDQRKSRERELLDITSKLAQANQKLRQLSAMDGLTGVPNRRYFDEVFEREWRRARRISHEIGLVLLGIDQFKLYNDHLGRLQGDDCLIKVAGVLASQVRRAGDLLARYGDDKFVALLSTTDLEGSRCLGKALRRAVEAAGLEHPNSPLGPVVTISVGVSACVVQEGVVGADLVAAANRALNQAKDQGRNQVAGLPISAGTDQE